MEYSTDAFINSINEVANDTNHYDIPKSLRKAIKMITKGVSQLDDTEFRGLMSLIIKYILEVSMNEDNDSYTEIQYLRSLIYKSAENHEESGKTITTANTMSMPRTRKRTNTYHYSGKDLYEIENPQNESPTRKMNIRLPSNLKGMKWLERPVFQMTAASDGVIYINHSMWEYLKEDAKRCSQPSPFFFMPNVYNDGRPSNKASLSYNIACNNDSILMVLKVEPNRLLDVTFYEKIGKDGLTYGTTDEDDNMTLPAASEFKLNGVYTFNTTTLTGMYIGKQIKSFDNDLVASSFGIRKV